MSATATFGGGCFWCLEPIFRDLKGVTDVVCGYAGGHVANPTYEQVCSGTTGHAEVVRVTFDPETIPYAELCAIFLVVHDPTTKDRQGADRGPQYRSIILAEDEEQDRTARAVISELEARRVWPAPIVTEVVRLDRFWPAEPYHQRYFERNPFAGYCRAVIAPKLAKFRQTFAERLKAA